MSGTEAERWVAELLIRGRRRLREFLGLSLQEVAESMGLSKQRVSDIEGGRNKPTRATLVRYLKALGGIPAIVRAVRARELDLREVRKAYGVEPQAVATGMGVPLQRVTWIERGHGLVETTLIEYAKALVGSAQATTRSLAKSGRPLGAIRRHLGLRQGVVARYLNFTQQWLSEIEGGRGCLDEPGLVALVRALARAAGFRSAQPKTGECLREIRERLGLTRFAVAGRMRVGEAQIDRIEKSGRLSKSTLVAYIEALAAAAGQTGGG